MITFKQYLLESIPFTRDSPHKYSFEVDGETIDLTIGPHDGEISFGFPHRGMSKFELTGKNKNQFKIINTVVEIIKQHTKNSKPGTYLYFTGNNKRSRVYSNLLKKFQADKEWDIEKQDYGYGSSFRLIKK